MGKKKVSLNYAINMENEDKAPNETHIYRNPDAKDVDLENYEAEFRTLHEAYNHNFSTKPKNPFLGERLMQMNGELSKKYHWYTKEEVKDRAERVGSGIVNLNLYNTNSEWRDINMKMVAVYSKNTINYLLLDFGACMQGITTVPIYDTLGEEATTFIFNQTKITTCFLSSNHVEKMLKEQHTNKKFKYLETLVVMDPENYDTVISTKYNSVFKVMLWDEVVMAGEQKLDWADVTPETPYSISYTSGTTGEPKGAVITHGNIVSVFKGVDYIIKASDKDVYLSYLPMAHIMERAAYNVFISRGVRIGVYNGDMTKLKDDLAILKPTIFISVPRLFNKFYDVIKGKLAVLKGFKKNMADKAVKVKLGNLNKNGKLKHWFYDLLIFNKIKKVFGGRVKIMITGSAPISQDVLDFLKIVFSCPIVEGYGQTEGSAGEFVTHKSDPLCGHVGGPVPQNEFKLVDVEEMNYTSKDVDADGNPAPRGEIWVRGPNVIPGYFLNEKETKKNFNEDGWLMSGDIGQILPNGNRMKIIDRKKNIFKLSQGEYIAPEKLENAYKAANPNISEVFIYGDSLKSCVIAIVNIEQEGLEKLAVEMGIEGDISDLANNEYIINGVMDIFRRQAEKKKFNKLEQPKKIHIESTLFADLDLLTTTFKKKRNIFKEHYKDLIDNLYKDLV